jgi:hypothetical protein
MKRKGAIEAEIDQQDDYERGRPRQQRRNADLDEADRQRRVEAKAQRADDQKGGNLTRQRAARIKGLQPALAHVIVVVVRRIARGQTVLGGFVMG